MEAKETCSTCMFWKQVERYKDRGECRRHGPRPSARSFWTAWPTTLPEDWCGDYEEKIEPPGEFRAEDHVPNP